MRLAIATAALLVLGLGTPSVAKACRCGISGYPGDGPPPRRERPTRDRIFIGHVLEVDHLHGQDPKEIVRFVVESSWRGAMPDTVTLRVGAHAACAQYIAGARYLVFADVDSVSGALVTEPCDYAWGIDYAAAVRMQNELGPPTWKAPSMGRRSIDRRAIRLGEPLMREGTDTVMILAPAGEDVARFEIGNYVSDKARWKLRTLRMSPGLYQFRITWTDGTKYESYVSMRCRQSEPGPSCPGATHLSLVRKPQ